MRETRWRRLLMWLAAAVLASASCGSASTPQTVDEDLTAFADSALVGLLDLDVDISEANTRASLNDELATACLRERGFDVPQLVTAPIEPEAMAVALQELGEEAFTIEHGFGVVDGVASTGTTMTTNPFDEYIASLGANEAESFRLALYGEPGLDEPSDSCRWIASVQVDEQLGAQRWDLFGQFATEVDDRINADSAVVALHQAYAACMAEKGYDYVEPIEPRRTAMDRFAEWASTNRFGGGSSTSDFRASLGDESRSSFDKLREQEINEARDSLACERPIRAQLVALYVEIERDWIRENNDRIQSLRGE